MDDPTIGGVAFKGKDFAGKYAISQTLLDLAGADVLGLVTATPAALSILGRLKSIADNTDGLEGFSDGVEGLLTTLGGYMDGLEALQTSANSSLTALGGYVDGLEAANATLIASVNALATPDYEAVAASQTDAILGGAGAAGDLLAGVLITPSSTSPGVVSIEDGAAGAAIVLFAGGANSVTTLHPFFVPFGAVSLAGGWRLTTGANVSAVAVGNFT